MIKRIVVLVLLLTIPVEDSQAKNNTGTNAPVVNVSIDSLYNVVTTETETNYLNMQNTLKPDKKKEFFNDDFYLEPFTVKSPKTLSGSIEVEAITVDPHSNQVTPDNKKIYVKENSNIYNTIIFATNKEITTEKPKKLIANIKAENIVVDDTTNITTLDEAYLTNSVLISATRVPRTESQDVGVFNNIKTKWNNSKTKNTISKGFSNFKSKFKSDNNE